MHDAIIKDHCHISTNSTINGEVVVNKNSFIGSSAVIKKKIKIQNLAAVAAKF